MDNSLNHAFIYQNAFGEIRCEYTKPTLSNQSADYMKEQMTECLCGLNKQKVLQSTDFHAFYF